MSQSQYDLYISLYRQLDPYDNGMHGRGVDQADADENNTKTLYENNVEPNSTEELTESTDSPFESTIVDESVTADDLNQNKFDADESPVESFKHSGDQNNDILDSNIKDRSNEINDEPTKSFEQSDSQNNDILDSNINDKSIESFERSDGNEEPSISSDTHDKSAESSFEPVINQVEQNKDNIAEPNTDKLAKGQNELVTDKPNTDNSNIAQETFMDKLSSFFHNLIV